jgi:type IV secretory pathway VirB3-like protein
MKKFYKEVNSKLFTFAIKFLDTEDEWLTIATTRPETILGDSLPFVLIQMMNVTNIYMENKRLFQLQIELFQLLRTNM